jgi:hypothetical protein
LQVAGRERQNSTHRGGNGTTELPSPTVSHAHGHGQQNKRSRTSSKKQNNNQYVLQFAGLVLIIQVMAVSA